MKILFVTTAFYPEQAIGSIRLTKLAQYLVELGIDITIISKQVSKNAPRDETLFFEKLSDISWQTIPQTLLFQRLFAPLRDKTVSGGGSFSQHKAKSRIARLKSSTLRRAQLIFTILKGLDWSRQVHSVARQTFAKGEFDIVLSSYPSFGSPVAAAKLKKAGFAKHLFVDFRDPVTYEAKNSVFLPLVQRYMEKKMTIHADCCLFISSGVKNMVTPHPNCHETSILSNGFEPIINTGSCAPTPATNILTFCYVGAMYGGRRKLGPFFQILAELIENGDIQEKHIKVVYAGKEFGVIERQARKYKLDIILTNAGFVSREESLNIQNLADICLLSTWNSDKDQGILTGKIFEYFSFRKPILAIVSGNRANSDVKMMIDKVNAGQCLELSSKNFDENKKALSNWVIQSYQNKRSVGELSNGYNDNVEQFSYQNIAQQLQSEFVAIINSKNI